MSGARLRAPGESADYWRFNRIHGDERTTGGWDGWDGWEGWVVAACLLAGWLAGWLFVSFGSRCSLLLFSSLSLSSRPPLPTHLVGKPPDYNMARLEDPNSLSIALGLMRPM